jgi:hypothetical protein
VCTTLIARTVPRADFITWTDALGLDSTARWLRHNPASATLVGISLTIVIALAMPLVVRKGVVRAVRAFAKRSKTAWDDVVLDKGLLPT